MDLYVVLGSHTVGFYPFHDPDGNARDNGLIIGPEDYRLEALTDWATSEPNFPWLLFEGRWGAWGGALGDLLGTRGPQGPMFRESGMMWDGISWEEQFNITYSSSEQIGQNITDLMLMGHALMPLDDVRPYLLLDDLIGRA